MDGCVVLEPAAWQWRPVYVYQPGDWTSKLRWRRTSTVPEQKTGNHP